MTRKFNLTIAACFFIFACNKNKVDEEVKPAVKFSFNKLTRQHKDGKTITMEQILTQIPKAKKEGYTLKSIRIESEKASFAEVSGTAPNFTITIKKAGTFTMTIVLEKQRQDDVTIVDCEVSVVLPSFVFNKLTKDRIGVLSTQEIFAQIPSAKTKGYTLKSIRIPDDKASFAEVGGTTPNFTITLKKAGTFTATIVLEHSNYFEISIQAEIQVGAVVATQFDKIYGGGLNHKAHAICETTNGFVIAGSKKLTDTNTDLWVFKIDLNGNKVWDKTFDKNNNHYEWANDIVALSGGGFVVAGITKRGAFYDIWVLKLSENGEKVWEKTYSALLGRRNNRVHTAVQDRDGDILLAGNTYSSTASKYDGWILKIKESDGTKILDRIIIGGASDDTAYSISPGVIFTNGGFAVMVAGTTESKGAGKKDMWFFSLNHNYNFVASQETTHGGAEDDEAKSILTTPQAIFIAGTTKSKGAGKKDIEILKVNPLTAEILWDKTFGTSQEDTLEPGTLVQTWDGNLAVVGSSYSSSKRYDWRLIKLNQENGSEILNKTFGEEGKSEKAHALIATKDGGFAIVGTKFVNRTKDDVWVLKLDKDGNK